MGYTEPQRKRCTATRADGQPCQGWAIRGTDPPRCAPHAGRAHGGAPLGNQNRLVHGFYSRRFHPDELADLVASAGDLTLDDEIALVRVCLRRLLDRLDEAEDPAALGETSSLVFAGTRTVARLLRDKRALTGQAADGLIGAIGQALDELASQWGVDL